MKKPEFIESTNMFKIIKNTFHKWPFFTVACSPLILIIALIRKFLLKVTIMSPDSSIFSSGYAESDYLERHYEREANNIINNMLMAESYKDLKFDFEKDYKINLYNKEIYDMKMPLIILNDDNVTKYYQQVQAEHLREGDYTFISHSWKGLGNPGLPVIISDDLVFLDYLCIPQKRIINEDIVWNNDLQKEFDICLTNFDSAIYNCSKFVAIMDPHYLTRTWCCVELCLAIAFRKKIEIHLVGKHRLIDVSFFEQPSWTVFLKLFKLSMTGETTFKKDKIFLLGKVRKSFEVLYWQVRSLRIDENLLECGLNSENSGGFINLTLIKFE